MFKCKVISYQTITLTVHKSSLVQVWSVFIWNNTQKITLTYIGIILYILTWPCWMESYLLAWHSCHIFLYLQPNKTILSIIALSGGILRILLSSMKLYGLDFSMIFFTPVLNDKNVWHSGLVQRSWSCSLYFRST